MQFACKKCSSPGLHMPRELKAEALVTCAGCGWIVSTWGAFKEQASRIILAQVADQPGSRSTGVDPLVRS